MSNLEKLYLKNSNIPKRYLEEIKLVPAKVDRQAYLDLNDIRTNAKEFVDSGDSLVICSTSVGNGKTTWATKIMKSYISSVSNYSFKKSTPALYINVASFLSEKKQAISDKTLLSHIMDLESKLLTSKLVVFDDLCVRGDTSQYDLSQLYYWIDYRSSNKLSCIYTTNLLPAQLENALDARLYSRVVNYSRIITFEDGDHRRQINGNSGTSIK